MVSRLLISALLACAVVACAEGDIGEDDAGADKACPSCAVGTQRCGEAGVEVCVAGDVCNGWAPGPPCPQGQECSGGFCAGCADACVTDEVSCAPDGVQRCVKAPSGCLSFGPATPCAAGSRCSDGVCVAADAPCEDACAVGTRTCADGGFRECGEHDDDPCLDWSAVFPCPGGAACAAGRCDAACADECGRGETRCEGDAVRACGDFDGDACLEPGAPTPCAAGERCQAGRCARAEAPCQDACAAGATRCDGAGVSSCADRDGDGCTEWGAPAACPGGQRCAAGRCEAECRDACAAGSTRCNGQAVEVCEAAGACTNWRAGLPCAAAEQCIAGACVAAQPEESPTLLEWAVVDGWLLLSWSAIAAPGDYVLRLTMLNGGAELARLDRVGPGQLSDDGAFLYDGFHIDEVCGAIRATGAPRGDYPLRASIWHTQSPGAVDSADLPVPASCR